VRLAVVVALALFGASACGGSNTKPVRVTKVTPGTHYAPFRKCTRVSGGFRACTRFSPRGEDNSAIYRRIDGGWAKVRAGLPGRVGFWRRVVAAPDGAMLVGQWSGECESPSTYFVAPADGKLRPIFGSHSSEALGWRGGLARVRLTEEIWRGSTRVRPAGIYLVDPITLAIRPERANAAGPGC